MTVTCAEKICVFRFRCPDCGYVHSVIPAFLQPYMLQEDLAGAAHQGATVEQVAEQAQALPCGGIDERTLASLIRGWNQRLAQLESGLWAWMLARAPHLTLPRAPSLWSTLQSAWRMIREKLPRMEDSLKKAILEHGVPSQFYCDNGSAFSSHHLVRICGKLGIQLSHSTVRRPAGRGKIERWFRFIDTSFNPEAYAMIEQGRLMTLAELNAALAAWLDGYYPIREHGSTKQSPKTRLASSKREMRRKTLAELTEIFLWEEQRTADKTGCVSLDGNSYEVDLELCRKRVLLRYDPFDLTNIQVWYEDKRYADATVVDLARPYDRRVKPERADPLVVEPDGQVAFLELAEQKRQAEWASEPVSYATSKGDDAE
uniref:Mu transposase C-terminal domain-containing protein n=1 Tax=Paenibacillus sabuli TaxID=2772509 RepID=UPI0037C90DFD